MGTPLNVLLVEDSEADALLVVRELKRAGYAVDHVRVDTREDMEAALRDRVWDLVITVAEPTDPVLDPSQPWPDNRRHVNAGSLIVTALSEQATGACRDINFDPTLVPDGIEISDDPILHARSGTYAKSFNLRQRENGDKSAGKKVTP